LPSALRRSSGTGSRCTGSGAAKGLDRAQKIRQAEGALTASRAEFVYYVDLYGSAIKIGYSRNVLRRLTELRRLPEHLLAVEPGGRRLEAERHAQFAIERHGGLEDFDRSPELLAHIEAIRATAGDPIDCLRLHLMP
jgi:hypothetical protein